MPSSGAVPRELAAGVVWESPDEVAWLSRYRLLVASGLPAGDAEREARWIVEADLHRRFVRRNVEKALKCRTANDKRALYQEWIAQFGKARADALARAVKHDRLREAALKW